MIAKYVLIIGLFHRVHSNYNYFGVTRTNFDPYESTPPKINVLQTQGNIDDLFGVMNGLRLNSQQTSNLQPSYVRLIKSQVSNPQLNNPQWSYSQLINPQRSYLQLDNTQQNSLQQKKPQRSYSQLVNTLQSSLQQRKPQRSYSQLDNTQQSSRQQRKPQPNVKFKNGTVDNKTVKIEPFGNNNNNIVYDHKVSQSQQQEKLKQALKLEAAERLKQQLAMERLQQQTVERLRQQAVEKLKQETINNLKQKQAHLFNLMEDVTKKRQENQKHNLEVWQRIAKQRDKHIQRRFYEHALHGDDDNDDDGDDND